MKKFIMSMALAIIAGVYTAQAQDVITDPVAAAQAQQDAIKAQKAAEKAAQNPGDLKLQAKAQKAAANATKAQLRAEKLAKKAK